MSAQIVETILSRAMSDAKFANSLFANPDQALVGFELTSEEVANFKSLSRAEFDAMTAASPEERKSFSIIGRP
jgi:hypothetical protein